MTSRRLPRVAVALSVALLLIPACDAAARQDFPPDAELAAMVRYLVEDGETEGIVLGVLEADGSTTVVAYGEAGPGADPLGPASVFEIGSVTKLFTATLLADMVARGQVALEDPVARYLPDGVQVPSYDGREITLADLATHTSGLPRDPEGLPDFEAFGVDAFYAWLGDHELRRAPGAEFEYSNLGAGLLGHALSRAAGMPLEALLEERILGPLGMTSTGYDVAGIPAGRLVHGFAAGVPLPAWNASEVVAGAGGLRSTVPDLLAFLAANAGPPESPLEEAMRTAHEPRLEADGAGVGLAWRSGELNGTPLLWHTGAIGGFRASVAIDPERGVGAVTLANAASYGETLARDLLAMGPPPPVRADPLPRATLESLTGEYRSESGLPFSIRLDHEGHLTAQGRQQIRYRLHPRGSDTSFISIRVPFALTFVGAADGEADAIVLDIQGRTNRFPRVGDESPSSVVVAGNAVPQVPAEDIRVYEGVYALEMAGRMQEFRVYGQDGKLIVERGSRVMTPLIPLGEHTFAFAVAPATQVRFEVQDGRAVRVGIRTDDGILTARRVR